LCSKGHDGKFFSNARHHIRLIDFVSGWQIRHRATILTFETIGGGGAHMITEIFLPLAN